MNVMTTRVYHTGAVRLSAATRNQQRTVWDRRTKWWLALLMVSALAVVYLKDLNRRTFIEYENMTRANQQAQIDWGKLLLEQSTWTAQAHVQQVATQRLRMLTPSAQEIVLVSQ
jgi:cell division protein FtsL